MSSYTEIISVWVKQHIPERCYYAVNIIRLITFINQIYTYFCTNEIMNKYILRNL